MVRLCRCEGVDAADAPGPQPKSTRGNVMSTAVPPLLLRGEPKDEAEDGDEHSSGSERLRLRTMVGVERRCKTMTRKGGSGC